MEQKIQVVVVCLLIAYIVHWFRHALLERRLDRMEKLLKRGRIYDDDKD